MSAPTADGITVHRCVVRVVRRGGWSWGPDPRDLVRQVVNALPGLLTDRLAGSLPHADGDDDPHTETAETVEITDPVVITVRLGQPGGDGPAVVLSDVVVASPVLTGAAPDGEEPSASAPVRAEWVAPAPSALFDDLAARGDLTPLLALLPDESLVTYLMALLATGAPALSGESPVAGFVAELARRRAPEPVPTTVAELVRELRSASARVLPDAEPRSSSAPGVSAPHPSAADRAGRSETVPAAPIAAGETRTCGALPFLLAGPLARTGYLDAVGPALAGVDVLADAPLFAAALAYKVLGAPARGWRRTDADHATAAAFAGLDEVPDLGAFSDRVRHALPVLDGLLALAASRGHDPADPLLVTGVDDGVLLVDAQGMFPVAWSEDVAGLVPHWSACGRPSVAVCDSPLPADCLRVLAAEGVDVVTDVRPLRGDPLTRLSRRTPLWTAGNPDPRLVAALPAHAERLGDLVRAFTQRRVVPRGGALDRSALLAAGTALGLIAWTLWHDRETTDPVLALTRFADLEATVRYGAETVHVRLPLGRRHADLLHHGLLADVPDVVWLGGRTLTFSGG